MECQIITCAPFTSNLRVFFTFSLFQQILIPYHLQELLFRHTHCGFLYAEMTAIFGLLLVVDDYFKIAVVGSHILQEL